MRKTLLVSTLVGLMSSPIQSDELTRILTWTVESANSSRSVAISENGNMERTFNGASVSSRALTSEETDRVFAAAEELIAVFPSLLKFQGPEVSEASGLRNLGASRQSESIRTTLKLTNGEIEVIATFHNYPALTALTKDAQHSNALRQANHVLGRLLVD